MIEFCFPGDYLGLGFLDKQHLNARALLESTGTAFPIDALPDLVKNEVEAHASSSPSWSDSR